MTIDLDRIEALAKAAIGHGGDWWLKEDNFEGLGFHPAYVEWFAGARPQTVLALVAAARALPKDTLYDGYGECYSCGLHINSIVKEHAESCRWAIARAALDGMDRAIGQ